MPDSTKKVLILFAHPRFEKSRANKALLHDLRSMEDVTFHDLYERYPDFNIDVVIEQDLLRHHDVIIWHHPFYWYSCPPLLKQWIDLVLEFGGAYGPEGKALHGKTILNAITTGGPREAYDHTGKNRFKIKEFMYPFDQTACLCGMTYLPPFAVMGTHRLNDAALEELAGHYRNLLQLLQNDGLVDEDLKSVDFINDLEIVKNSKS